MAKSRIPGEYKSVRDEAVMLFVPDGDFEMGSDAHDEDEAPKHRVTLSAFFIDKTEVTNGRYRKFLDWWRLAPPDRRRAFSHRDEPPDWDHTPAFWPRPRPAVAKTSGEGDRKEETAEKKPPPVSEEPVVGVSNARDGEAKHKHDTATAAAARMDKAVPTRTGGPAGGAGWRGVSWDPPLRPTDDCHAARILVRV